MQFQFYFNYYVSCFLVINDLKQTGFPHPPCNMQPNSLLCQVYSICISIANFFNVTKMDNKKF